MYPLHPLYSTWSWTIFTGNLLLALCINKEIEMLKANHLLLPPWCWSCNPWVRGRQRCHSLAALQRAELGNDSHVHLFEHKHGLPGAAPDVTRRGDVVAATNTSAVHPLMMGFRDRSPTCCISRYNIQQHEQRARQIKQNKDTTQWSGDKETRTFFELHSYG